MSSHPTKRQIILEASAQLFRDRGYAATSMRDIAKEVHLQASSLYNHISGKQEILREICFQNARRFLEGIQELDQKDEDSLSKIKALLQLHLKIATEDVTSITSFNDEWRHLEAHHLSEFIKLRKQYESQFKKIIERGMEEGVFKKISSTIVLNTFLSSIRWVYDWYDHNGPQPISKIGDSVIELLLSGLRK